MAAGASFKIFEDAVVGREMAACLARDAFPAPPSGPSGDWQIGTSQFPNLGQIRAQNSVLLNQSAAVVQNPAAHMPPAEKRAYIAALLRCNRLALRPFARFDGSLGGESSAAALEQEWMSNDYAAVTASAPVQAAGRRSQACAARRGYRFSPIRGDYMVGAMLWVAPTLQSRLEHRGPAAARAEDASLAQTLYICLTPLDQLRGRLLAARRAQFFAANAAAIDAISAAAERMITALSRRYNTTLGRVS